MHSLNYRGLLRNISLLRRVSRFVAEKTKRRTKSGQLRGFIFQVTRGNSNIKSSIEKLLCPVEISAPALSSVDQESPTLTPCMLYTGHCDVYTGTVHNNHLQSLTMCSSTHADSSPGHKCTLSHRFTFCGTPLITSNPLVSSYMNSRRAEPPLTPVKQIIRTPLHPPQLKCHESRTRSRGNRTSTGVDIDFEYQISKADFLDTPYNTCSTHKVLAPQYRLSPRHFSYPHFRIASSSYAHPPLNLATAFNGCQDLASPLIIRSSNPTTTHCTPQAVKNRGSVHLQWSPYCLGCFA